MKIKQMFQREGLAILLVATLAACGKSEPQDMAPAPVQVSVMTMAPSRLDITEDLPGRVAAVRVAEIRPQVSGVVQRRLFEQGTEVRAGQPLFQINPAALRAEADTAAAALQRAEAALARAQVQTNRLKPLLDADAISRQAYDDAASLRDQSAAEVAQARATLARRQLDLKFSTVEAPISGRIDQALVTEGTLVNSGDSNPMARVQQIDQVYVDVRRPASSLESVHDMLSTPSARNSPQVAVLRSDGTPYGAKGRILFSGVNVDAGTGDVLLRVLVNNPERELLPGMFVRARVARQSYDMALTVPQQAVVRIGGQPQVWVIDKAETARLSAVELDELVGGDYRIRTGLSAGQTVVVEGMERLSAGTSVSAREWQAPASASAAVSALR